MPAVNRRIQFFLNLAPHIKHARAARAEQPFVRVGGEKIHVFDRRRKRAERLDGVEAKKNSAFAQKFSDGVEIKPIAADEMARRQRDEPRVFVHLPHHVHRADRAEAARVQQAHLHAAFRQRHPRINVRRIIVVINEDVVAFAKFQSGGDKTQRERSRPDERDFVRLAIQQLRAEFAPVVNAVHDEGFLIAERAFIGAVVHRLRDAARQRADAGVREKNFVARDGKFVLAQFLVGENFSQSHGVKINSKGSQAKRN